VRVVELGHGGVRPPVGRDPHLERLAAVPQVGGADEPVLGGGEPLPRQRVGRLLAQAAIAEGRARGYARMRLDTVPGMEAAQELYRTLGFYEVEPYRYNPTPGTRFMELRLDAAALG
jgi:GNAT superfamily N-acetyltransferase